MGNVWTHVAAAVGGFVLGTAVGWVANDLDKESQQASTSTTAAK